MNGRIVVLVSFFARMNGDGPVVSIVAYFSDDNALDSIFVFASRLFGLSGVVATLHSPNPADDCGWTLALDDPKDHPLLAESHQMMDLEAVIIQSAARAAGATA